MTNPLFPKIRQRVAAATKVVAWYAHPTEVRGPFNRWLTVSDVAPKYRKHVASQADDAAYAAAAMNMVPKLLEALDIAHEALEAAGRRHNISCDIECVGHCPVKIRKDAFTRIASLEASDE